MGDVAATVDTDADTVPAFTTTVAVCVMAIPSIVAEIVLDSARVDDNVPVAPPLAFVVAAGCVRVLPPPVAASTTVAPCTGLPLASRAVTVIVELPLPAVIGEVAVTVDCAADTAPAFTTTVAVCVTPTALIVAEIAFDSASVDASVPTAPPPLDVRGLPLPPAVPPPPRGPHAPRSPPERVPRPDRGRPRGPAPPRPPPQSARWP